MAKRVTRAQSNTRALLVLSTVIVVAVIKLVEVTGIGIPLTILLAAVGGFFCYKISRKRIRLKHLRHKYGNEEIVQLILHHRFWQGQTSEQLIDSIGSPASVDHMIFKTKARQIWKYDRRGDNRYGLRITLDEGIVIGWNQKSR